MPLVRLRAGTWRLGIEPALATGPPWWRRRARGKRGALTEKAGYLTPVQGA